MAATATAETKGTKPHFFIGKDPQRQIGRQIIAATAADYTLISPVLVSRALRRRVEPDMQLLQPLGRYRCRSMHQ